VLGFVTPTATLRIAILSCLVTGASSGCASEAPLGDLEGTYDLRELTPTLFGGDVAPCEFVIEGQNASASCDREHTADDPESGSSFAVTESLTIDGTISEGSVAGSLEYTGSGTSTEGCATRLDEHSFSLDVARTATTDADGLFAPAAGTWEGTVTGTSHRERMTGSGDDCEPSDDDDSWAVEFTVTITGDTATFDYTLNDASGQFVARAVDNVVEVDDVAVPKIE